MKRGLSAEQRMAALTLKTSCGCWVWLGSVNGSHGYGKIKVDGVWHRTHRLTYELVHGSIPKGMLVCHRCDIRSCRNPKHLFLGSNSINSKDMGRKKRGAWQVRPMPQEVKDKISAGNSGKVRSAEQRTAQAVRMTGMKQSEEARKKRSESLKGRVFSYEHKEKLSTASKGVPKSKEHCAKLSAIWAAKRLGVYDGHGKK